MGREVLGTRPPTLVQFNNNNVLFFSLIVYMSQFNEQNE